MKTEKNKNTHVGRGKTAKVMAASMAAAASILDCRPAILKAAKQNGAPGFRANGSVCISDVSEWLASNPGIAEEEDAKTDLELRKLRAQCEKLEFELLVTRGEYIHKDEFERDAIRVADLFRTELLAFHADQVTWEGLPAVERDRRGKDRVRASMENLKRVLTGRAEA